MAATMTWADPSMACATGLDGLLSWLATWAADEDDRRLAADPQRRTGYLDRLQRGDHLAGAHPGQHGGRDGRDLLSTTEAAWSRSHTQPALRRQRTTIDLSAGQQLAPHCGLRAPSPDVGISDAR